VANEALKAGSPLDAALKNEKYCSHGRGISATVFATKGKPVVISRSG